MLFFEPIYSSLFLKFAIPVLKTLSLSLPTAPKRAKSVEVGLGAGREMRYQNYCPPKVIVNWTLETARFGSGFSIRSLK
jgi:hypothetical protein